MSRVPAFRKTAVTVRPAVSDVKGSINLRIEASTRRLIDEAAELLGKTRTEIMIESARSQAIEALLDQRLFRLDPERHDAFLQALDNPRRQGQSCGRCSAGRPRGRPERPFRSRPVDRRPRPFRFDCGEPALNDWLRRRALRNESRFSRSYVVCEQEVVVGYYCISAGAVEREAAPGKVRRNAPDTIPISVIGRLAVSRSHAGRGLGADLLSDALRRIALASQSIGIGAVLVQAKTTRRSASI